MQLRAASPYEASKAAADAIALSYRPAYGLPVAVTRFANIYGGGDLNFSRLIPETIAAVLDGRRAGDPLRRQPRARLPLRRRRRRRLPGDRARGRRRRPGGGRGLQRRRRAPALGRARCVEPIADVSGAGLEPEYLGTGNPAGEIDRQYVDSTKLRELTGWAPEVELRDGLRPHPRLVPRPPGGARPGWMCGRFTVTTKDTKKIADRFQVELEKALERGRGDGEGAAAIDGAGGEGRRRGSGASTSPRPRRSSPCAPRPTPRRPRRASARRG